MSVACSLSCMYGSDDAPDKGMMCCSGAQIDFGWLMGHDGLAGWRTAMGSG